MEQQQKIHILKLIKLGAQDKFGKSGKASELLELYGISSENIVNKILQEIGNINN